MENSTPIYYKDLIRPDNSITDLISQLQDLIAEYDTARAKIQSTAADMVKSMQSVSGATESQRQAIVQTAKETDEMAAQMRTLRDKEIEAANSLAVATQANKEYNQLVKLQAQLNRSAEGSYNQLSAQYRIIKMRLNEMSEAERKGTESGRALEKQAKDIYSQMNKLQTATGKYTLQVGNYERALGGALGVNMSFIETLTDTERLTDTLKGAFGALVSPIGLVTVAIGAAVAAVKLFASSIHSTQATGDAFDYAMAGWNSTWDYFKKAVATVDFSNFISGMREAYRAGKELKMTMDELFERKGSVALQKAMMSEENSILLERLRNQKLSIAERKKAGEDYLKNISGIYEQEKVIAKDAMDAALSDLFAQTNKRKKLTDAEVEQGKAELANYIQTYNLNRDKIKQAKELNEALEKQNDWKKYLMAQNADEETKTLMRIVKQYDLTNDKQVEAYRKAAEDYYNLQGALYNENSRIINQINSLDAQLTKESTTNARARAKAAEDEAAAKAKAAEEAVKAEEKRRAAEVDAAEKAYLDLLNHEKNIINYQIAAADEGSKEMADLRLARLEKEREIELELNSRKTEEMRIDEALINAKYDKLRGQEAAKYGEEAAEAVSEGMEDAKARKSYSSIWDLIIPEGDTDEQKERMQRLKEGISQLASQLVEFASQMIGYWVEAADKAVQSADKQVEAAQRIVDGEREAAANGYANNVKQAEKELALEKKKQQAALEEKERAQKAQMALETVMQAVSLVTASANIWSSMSSIPVVGPALAIASIALMWGSFLATKIKAAQVAKESYGEGTVELLQGGSHASGHDISLGRKADGTERRAEGGEFFAVINKRNSRRYRNEIPAVIESFNDGTFAEKYQRANSAMAGYAVEMIGGGSDLSRLESGVDAIRRQGEARRSYEGGALVIRYKNLTQRIKT